MRKILSKYSNRYLRGFLASTLALISAPYIAMACGKGIADTTTYFLPHVDAFCKDGQICSAFKSAVRMQGSGKLRDGRVYRYTGKKTSVGDCDTTTGAAGTCLIPYISIAADPSKYRMGTIIEMPALRGHVFRLADGSQFVHPGYLRVDDTGGAIKGTGRFDLFTGFHSPRSSRNSFGFESDFQMSAKENCSVHKKYSVIKRGEDGFDDAHQAIENAIRGHSLGQKSSHQMRVEAVK